MDKVYNKFYEVGNNVYYATNFNDTNYIGIESLLVGKSPIPKRERKITQGFKLLEVSPCIGILFQAAYNSNPTVVDEEFPDMNKYEIPDETEIRKMIKATYENAKINEINSLNNWYEKQVANCESEEQVNEISENYQKTLKQLQNLDIFKGMIIDLKNMEKKCPILTSLRMNGLKFLYIQEYTSLYNVAYMYEIDIFGTITIYKIDIVKGKIKGMDSYMINKPILGAYYDYLYKNNL